jgi:hypothetical protein
MLCKGCLGEVGLPPESVMYYRLNDVVKNCLISDSGSKNDTHGNLTVLLTLLWKYRESERGFYYLPPQNYYCTDPKNPVSDIDILCVSDGNLCIGEAKNSVDKFDNKVIDQLIFLGRTIKPNEIILAFKEGDISKLDKTIKKIKEGINDKNCRVVPHKVSEAAYQTYVKSIAP